MLNVEPLTLDEAREIAVLVQRIGLTVVAVNQQSRELVVRVPSLNVRSMT